MKINLVKWIGGGVGVIAAGIMSITPMTVFAQEPQEVKETVRVEAEKESGISENEVEAKEEVTEDTEIPYRYEIKEDGSIVFYFNGEEYTYGEENPTIGTLESGVHRLNVRTGAGMEHEVIDQLCPGEEVYVIGTEGDWYQIIVPEKTGYVHSDYLNVIANATNETDAALLQMFMMMFIDSMNGTAQADGPLTPDGNMNLIDDYGSQTGAGKQFITLTTKNGNYFYLIIDRDDNGTETVHFLNLVDEADLLSLMEEGEVSEHAGTVTEQPVDSTVTPVPDSEKPSEEPVEEPKDEKKTSGKGPLIILLLAGVGGAGFYFVKKKGKNKNVNVGPDPDMDYNEEEDYLSELNEEEEEADIADEIEEEE